MKMDVFQKTAVLLSIIGRIRDKRDWCGETHAQKLIYFIQELGNVDLGLEFLLYKHAPISFHLKDEISLLYANQLINFEPTRYGHSLVPNELGKAFIKRYPRILAKTDSSIDFFIQELGEKSIRELEHLSTAHYILNNYSLSIQPSRILAAKIVEIKPYISFEEALVSVLELENLLKRIQQKEYRMLLVEEEQKVPELTPEILEELKKESEELRKEFNKRIKKMWNIPPEDWFGPTY